MMNMERRVNILIIKKKDRRLTQIRLSLTEIFLVEEVTLARDLD